MKKFTKTNIRKISVEHAHGGSGLRQVLVRPGQVSNKYFEAFTKGFLRPNSVFDWHIHKNTDEIFIVLKGNGTFYWENKKTNYSKGDIFTIPADSKHKLEAKGKVISEFYFIRIRSM